MHVDKNKQIKYFIIVNIFCFNFIDRHIFVFDFHRESKLHSFTIFIHFVKEEAPPFFHTQTQWSSSFLLFCGGKTRSVQQINDLSVWTGIRENSIGSFLSYGWKWVSRTPICKRVNLHGGWTQQHYPQNVKSSSVFHKYKTHHMIYVHSFVEVLHFSTKRL